MMKKLIASAILASAFSASGAAASAAQEPVAAAVPDTLSAVVPDTLSAAVADSAAFSRSRVNFIRGTGAPIDTIDVGDDLVKVVLCDDNSWYFIKDLDKLAGERVFTEYWDEKTVNSYKDVSIAMMPTHCTIILADSLNRWTCPYCTKVFSKFGYRHHRRHQGVDLPYPVGTPVKAAFDGRVRVSMWTKGYGNLVVIRHDNGLETYYGHLSERKVQPGDWVHSGDVIGLGGSTGRSTGPHLHFETRYRGFAFDPQWLADFETGKLHRNVFILRRSYLDPVSHYVPESMDEEEEIYLTDEQIAAEEERIAAEKAAMRWHTVRSGQTVSGIAAKYGKTVTQIKKLNPNLNVNRISIGQKIRVN